MRRRRGAGLIVAIAAMVWIAAIVTASTLLVVETIGAVEREVAKLRADAAIAGAAAMVAASPATGDRTVSLDGASADVHVTREDGALCVRVRSTGWGRNDVTQIREAMVRLPDRDGA